MADAWALSGVENVPPGGTGAAVSPAGGKPDKTAQSTTAGKNSGGSDTLELSPEARRKVAELARVDQQVRAHEAAHMAAGAGLVRGGASFSFQRGPDGKSYAVAGEVSLDTSPVPDNPAATLRKAEQIRSAALAPADPSPQDRKVASEAGAMAQRAAVDMAQKAGGAAKRTGGRLDVLA